MINPKTNQRELAYVVEIDDIEPIVGSDNCEAAVVNGWKVMVKKNSFQPKDLAVYFEIDSHLDTSKPEFAFLEKKHGNIKTQKYTFGGKGNFISQGLIMGLSEFGFDPAQYKKGDFLTEQLGVTYATKEDNARKASRGDNKYARMAKHHPKLAKTWVWRKLYKTNIGKKILYLVFGRVEKKRSDWPAWVQKTDEERIQNMTWILNDKEPWIVTEKIDGTSTTFTLHKKKRGRGYDFYVCSRNVVFDSDEKKCYYDENYYTAMAKKYNVEEVLTKIAQEGNYEWVTLQGETFGKGVQKREYNLDGQEFFGFNFITDREGRWNSVDAANKLFPYGIHWVPILDKNFILPDTLEEMLAYADGESICDFGMREGVVLRSQDGTKSFKAVSNDYLLKYHS